MIEYKTFTVDGWRDVDYLEKLLKNGWSVIRADSLLDGSSNLILYILQKGRSVKHTRKKVR